MNSIEIFEEEYKEITELSDKYGVSEAQIIYALSEIVKREKLIDKIKDYV